MHTQFHLHYAIAVSYSVLEGNPHSVRFTVNPSLGQGQNDMITHYTINCTSESSGDEVAANGTLLESIILTFVPATRYVCSISLFTVNEAILHFNTIHLLTGEFRPYM